MSEQFYKQQPILKQCVHVLPSQGMIKIVSGIIKPIVVLIVKPKFGNFRCQFQTPYADSKPPPIGIYIGIYALEQIHVIYCFVDHCSYIKQSKIPLVAKRNIIILPEETTTVTVKTKLDTIQMFLLKQFNDHCCIGVIFIQNQPEYPIQLSMKANECIINIRNTTNKRKVFKQTW